MKISKQEIERRMASFSEACRDAGVKLTPQRMEIFREVAQASDHPDADKVFQRVRGRLPTVSLDTIYRTLWMLNDLGLIATLGASRERTRFDANLSRHHHFICRQCGLTKDFYSDNLNELQLPESIKAIGYVETTRVEVRGFCLECAAREKSKVK